MDHPFDRIDQLAADKQKILDHIASLIEAIPENSAIKRLAPNCYTIMASELFKHDNWTPAFHDFKSSALIVNDILTKRNAHETRIIFDGILASKSVTVNGKKQNLHPEFIDRLKEIYNS
jgi:hypothetical protein